jgi:eukaryotic-like serine/threonine-protein kinase
MGDEENASPRGRLIAMLSAFGVTPDIDGPSTPTRADAIGSDARGSVSGHRPVREAILRPRRKDLHPECVLGPDEQGLLRLLEEVARASPLLRRMPRESSPFGRYMVLHEIGRGGSGILYLGTDPERDRPVVLKVASPETLDDAERLRRFGFEGRVASRLDHPNIVPVHEVGEVDGLPYIAMAYVEGGTLADWLLGNAPATPRQASRLVREIAGAVGYAHDRGVLNLDLKPGNVMLSPVTPASPEDLGVVPLVIDFGLARLLDGGDEAMDGMDLVGTPPYMAPEQVREGSRGCGRPTDVHALGVILYELLVGWPPFLGENRLQTIRAMVENEPFPPGHLRASVPPELEAICLKCLEKSPDRRFSTAHELHDELGRFLDGDYAPSRSMDL